MNFWTKKNKKVPESKSSAKDLEDALAFRSETISIMAHQLRTRLSATKWILAMFLDGDYGKLPPEQATLLKKAKDAIEDAVKISSDLINVNHTEDMSLGYDFRLIDIVRIIDDVIFDFTGESSMKRISIIFPRPVSPLPLIEGDEEKIRMVIQNLIENAIKYSEEGDQVFLSILQTEDGEIEISIRDTGIGIPKEEQPKIFEKFFRASNAKSTSAIGSGIGLYAIKKIVEGHSGKLTFTSKIGDGTTFYLHLPLTQKK